MNRNLAVIGLVRHVTAERSVMAKHGILHHRLARADGLEELPQVRPQIVVVIALEGEALGRGLMPGLWIVLGVPLAVIGIAQPAGKGRRIVGGTEVDTRLRHVADAKLSEFDDSLGSPET